MGTTKPAPSTPALAGRHPYDIKLERQPDETDEAWAALINDLNASPGVTVTRLADHSIGLRRAARNAA